MFDWRYRPSVDEIVTIVRNVRTLTLVYFDEDHMLETEELRIVHDISRDLGTGLEVLCCE